MPKYLKNQQRKIRGLADPNGLLANLQNRQPAHVSNYKRGSDTESDDTIPGYLSKKKNRVDKATQNQDDSSKAGKDEKAESDGDTQQEEVKKVKKNQNCQKKSKKNLIVKKKFSKVNNYCCTLMNFLLTQFVQGLHWHGFDHTIHFLKMSSGLLHFLGISKENKMFWHFNFITKGLVFKKSISRQNYLDSNTFFLSNTIQI